MRAAIRDRKLPLGQVGRGAAEARLSMGVKVCPVQAHSIATILASAAIVAAGVRAGGPAGSAPGSIAAGSS
jgi:hypothetical protein